MDWFLMALVWTAIAVAVVAAALHLTWAMGSQWGAAHVFPEKADESARPFTPPGAMATVAVAVALGVFATLLWWTTWHEAPGWAWWLLAVAALLLVVRACGDRRYVGFFKTVRDTEFARRDDAVFTPIIVLLAVGAVSALHIAGLPARL